MSNYMILSSLTAALIILIRINWGLETGCTCKPSLWPLPGLLSLNWESWRRKSSAPGAQTLPFLTSLVSCKQLRGAGHQGSSSEWDWSCGRDGHVTIPSSSGIQVKKNILTIRKYAAGKLLSGFLLICQRWRFCSSRKWTDGGFGLMKTFLQELRRTKSPEQSGAAARPGCGAEPGHFPVLRYPGNRPEPSFLCLLTHEFNVQLMQIYSSHFSLWLYLLAADWHESASGSPDPADRCSRGSAAPAAAAGAEP